MGVWTSDQGDNASVRDALTLGRTLCVTQDVELQEGRGAAKKVMDVGSTLDRSRKLLTVHWLRSDSAGKAGTAGKLKVCSNVEAVSEAEEYSDQVSEGLVWVLCPSPTAVVTQPMDLRNRAASSVATAPSLA